MRCRQEYGITEDLLRQLQAHRLLISQETIDWRQQPHPTLCGFVDDDVPWKASFVLGGWLVEITQPIEERQTAARLIRKYLDSVTPAWLDRIKAGQTKIRRYCFFIAAGATIVTIAWFLRKRADRQGKELREAEEAEES